MSSGYFSMLKRKNKDYQALADKRRKANKCVRCGGKINHTKYLCDYCGLKQEIRQLKKTLTRIFDILEDKKVFAYYKLNHGRTKNENRKLHKRSKKWN